MTDGGRGPWAGPPGTRLKQRDTYEELGASGCGASGPGIQWGERDMKADLGMQNLRPRQRGGVPVMKAGTPQPSM